MEDMKALEVCNLFSFHHDIRLEWKELKGKKLNST